MKIGYTGLTWERPGAQLSGYHEVAELGYLGFEPYASTLLEVDFRPLAIPIAAGYCGRSWIAPESAAADQAGARREAEALREIGGETFVVSAYSPAGSPTDEDFRRLADALNEVGRYCRSIGLRTGLHPHTGSLVETGQNIDRVLELTDPELVGFAPDTGQIAKGGSDVLEVMRRHRDRITHVHVKDWNGHAGADDRSGYNNYEPIGSGVLPFAEIFGVLDGFEGWVSVELDRTPWAPRPPREAAAISRRYLGELLGDRMAWRR